MRKMKSYAKPVVLANDEVAEGVYAGSGGTECYTVTARIHQGPETGRETYVIQANATHAAEDGHHSANQLLTLNFNQPVTFVNCTSSEATYESGNGTNSLKIKYKYHANASEDHGLGEIEVKSELGLALTKGHTLSCDHKCIYNHPW